MADTLSPEVFTNMVLPILSTAKDHGATADSLIKVFIQGMTKLFAEGDLKEATARVGFINLLNAEGGCVPAKGAAKLYGGPTEVSEEAVRKAARSGQLIAVRDGLDNLHFPVWQFGPRGGVLPGLREILPLVQARPHADDLAPLIFFLNPSARLGGKTPLEALQAGGEPEITRVKRLAAALAE